MPSDPAAAREALTFALVLGALAAARLVFGFVPGMWMWGLNLQRFLDPPMAWLPWGLAALALAPPFARRIEPAATRLGDALARGRAPVLALFAALPAALVLGSPDNTFFAGDFLLRQGAVEVTGRPAVLFPQALPLDVLLHYTLPAALQSAHVLTANGTARAIGVVDTALLALFAALLVRALSLRGAAALAAWMVAVFGGHLGMFTGYSKALAELVVIAAAIAAYGVRVANQGRGTLGLGLALAIGLALHRSAIVMMLPAGMAWRYGARAAPARLFKRPRSWIAIGIPLVTLGIYGPKIVSTFIHVDAAVHLAPLAVRREGVLGAAFAGVRGLDLLNLALLLAPLALAVGIAAATRLVRSSVTPRAERAEDGDGGGAGAVLLALALPMIAVAPFIYPAQGIFRDWDDFAPLGAALSLLAAWRVGRIVEAARAWRWIAISAGIAAFATTVQWLALNANVDQGLRRARSFVTEPPPRTAIESAGVWDFLGIRNYRLDRYHAASEAFSHAAEFAPSPRMLQEWALAATIDGDLRLARDVYERLVVKDPKNPSAWLGLASVCSRIPDVDESFRATRALLALDPHDEGGNQLIGYLKKTYPDHP